MSRAPVLQTSIDLDAELRKITQRQHLNQVHYLVQLVRHALLLKPNRIRIDNRGSTITIEQDGDVFPQQELEMLEAILSRNMDNDEFRQRCLSRLELEHGVAILSLILNAPQVEILSGIHKLTAIEGRFWREEASVQEPGYRISFKRYAGNPRDEARELAYYCACARADIQLNGHSIAKPLTLEGQMLISRFETEAGFGAVGIPIKGDLCHLQIYKHGVRLGTKQFTPQDGMLFQGYWDSKISQFEATYHRSILAAESKIFEMARMLYATLDQHFDVLPKAHQQRVCKLILNIPGDAWPDGLYNLPLFQGQHAAQTMTMRHMLGLHARFRFIPYTQRSESNAPYYIPRLSNEDLLHFRKHRNIACHRLRKPIQPEGIKPIQPKHTWEAPSPSPLSEEQRQLLQALNLGQYFTRFHITETHPGIYKDKDGIMLVGLPSHHAFLPHAIRCMTQSSNRLGWLRYRFIAAAQALHR